MKKLEMQLSMHQKEFKNLQQQFDTQVSQLNAQIAANEDQIRDQAEQIADLLENKAFAEQEIERLNNELGNNGKELEFEKKMRSKLVGKNTELQDNVQRLEKISGVKKKPAPDTKKVKKP